MRLGDHISIRIRKLTPKLKQNIQSFSKVYFGLFKDWSFQCVCLRHAALNLTYTLGATSRMLFQYYQNLLSHFKLTGIKGLILCMSCFDFVF